MGKKNILTKKVTFQSRRMCYAIKVSQCLYFGYWKNYYYYYFYSALGPVWAETRVQSGDWYGSGTLHPGLVLRGSLPLLSPAF